MKPSKAFTLIELLVVISIIALLIGILLPVLAAARQAARKTQSSTQVRGIHQALVTHSQGNRTFFVGLGSNGKFVNSGDPYKGIESVFPGNQLVGAKFPRVRYEILMDSDFFNGGYCISPADADKDEWTSGGVTTDNYSYTMLEMLPGTGAFATSLNPGRKRHNDWRDTVNSKAIIMSDRNTSDPYSQGSSSDSSDPAGAGTMSSVWTTQNSGSWIGTIAWNDNHTGFAQTHIQSTKYTDDEAVENDNIFFGLEAELGQTGIERHGNAILTFDKPGS